MTITIQATLPLCLAEQQMDALIREGWFPNADVLIAEALRRFLDKGCQYEYNPSMTWDPMYRAAGLREVDLYQHKEVDYG